MWKFPTIRDVIYLFIFSVIDSISVYCDLLFILLILMVLLIVNSDQ